MLSYIDDCVYWYTSEELVKLFLDAIGDIFNVNFPGYGYWFMSIRISQLNEYSISVDQAIYAKSVFEKYLDTVTIK